MNRKNMENETLKERYLGTIFGQAVGDALGLSTEFMSKQEVDCFYPNGNINNFFFILLWSFQKE